MPAQEEKKEPIEKREIRGLTAESIIKYGSFIMLGIYGYFSIQKRLDENQVKIKELTELVIVIQTKFETSDIKYQTLRELVGRLEERIKNLEK